MKIPTDTFLRLVENAGTLGFIDIEAVGLRGDYNSTLCVSIKPFNKKPYTFVVDQPGKDKKVVLEAREALESLDAWVTYYGKGFDIKFLNTRLLNHDKLPIEKRPHIDLYYTLKSSLLTARRSQGHLLSWLRLPEQKMTVSADDWSTVIANPKKVLPIMIKRCESDVSGLEALYKRTKHLILDITR